MQRKFNKDQPIDYYNNEFSSFNDFIIMRFVTLK